MQIFICLRMDNDMYSLLLCFPRPVQIGHNNKGLGPAWYLQHVEVHNQNTNASAFFIADQ
eukprot:scaffold389255_cov16-Prasinocladus_malaysianus.AAC.1